MSTRSATSIALALLMLGCFAPGENDPPDSDDSSSSNASSESETMRDADDTTSADDTTGAPDCPAGLSDDARWDEACFAD